LQPAGAEGKTSSSTAASLQRSRFGGIFFSFYYSKSAKTAKYWMLQLTTGSVFEWVYGYMPKKKKTKKQIREKN
jgi:hypothetical protein